MCCKPSIILFSSCTLLLLPNCVKLKTLNILTFFLVCNFFFSGFWFILILLLMERLSFTQQCSSSFRFSIIYQISSDPSANSCTIMWEPLPKVQNPNKSVVVKNVSSQFKLFCVTFIHNIHIFIYFDIYISSVLRASSE